MTSDKTAGKTICVIGDVHGHLQLALCIAARWQRELAVAFDAVFLCGDVGTFSADDQLDSTTRRHGKANPCELEFLYQWSVNPQPIWLGKIFESVLDGGLGLLCPVVMVHGNHDGFTHLQSLIPSTIPAESVATSSLPTVDTGGHIHYLPSGWRCRTAAGFLVAGVGGVDRGQGYASYHDMAYIDQEAVAHLLDQPPVDVLITHQGPSEVQGITGSETLQLLLEAEFAGVWFHGHSVRNPAIAPYGPNSGTLLVPLADVAFPCKGPNADDPGEDGWSTLDAHHNVRRERPGFWREYRKRKWKFVEGGQLVCPDLACWAE